MRPLSKKKSRILKKIKLRPLFAGIYVATASQRTQELLGEQNNVLKLGRYVLKLLHPMATDISYCQGLGYQLVLRLLSCVKLYPASWKTLSCF